MDKIKVLIVDDSLAARDGLVSLLRSNQDIDVVGEATDGIDAIARAGELQPTIILMDAQMNGMDGCEATRQIKELFPEIKVLFMAVHPSYVEAAFAAGADSFLLKDSGRRELLQAIRNLAGLCA